MDTIKLSLQNANRPRGNITKKLWSFQQPWNFMKRSAIKRCDQTFTWLCFTVIISVFSGVFLRNSPTVTFHMYNVLWHNSFVIWKTFFKTIFENKREIWIAIKLISNIFTLVDVSTVFKVLLSRVSTMIGPFLKRYMLFLERITSWLFWCVGALYTAHIIATSITRFFKYPSIITARNGI